MGHVRSSEQQVSTVGARVRTTSRRAAWAIACIALGCGPNASGVGRGGSDDASSTTAGATTQGTTSSSVSATSANGTLGGGTGTSTQGAGSADETTDPMPGTSSGSASSGEPPGPVSYPNCPARDDCPRPYDQCFSPGQMGVQWCTHECDNDGECRAPSSGNAIPRCTGMNGLRCALDCSDGAQCPDGMDCVGLGMDGQAMRCAWPAP